MTDIWFYHLQQQTLEKVLPTLLERSLARDWHVIVQAKTGARLAKLDEFLWTYSAESFLGHDVVSGDAELDAMQPILLTTGQDNPNEAKIRFFIEGASIAPVLEAAGPEAYERAILIFDGNDDEELIGARAQWKELKATGHTLAYWQQGENGGWEKKA